VVALPVPAGGEGRIGGPVGLLHERLGLSLHAHLEHARGVGGAGEVVTVPTPSDPTVVEVLLVGVGSGSPADLRSAGAAVARAVRGRRRLASFVTDGVPAEESRAFAEGLLLGSYRFRVAPLPAHQRPVRHVDLVGSDPSVVALASATATAVALARDLANTPSSTKSPAWLADQARAVAHRCGLRLQQLDVEALRRRGYGGIVGVGAGSVRPPCLVELRYRAPRAAARRRHVVLVGKGITFDSGGLSLKPAEAMVPMKTDMAGAASVLAAMSALGELGVQVDVTALLALAENLPSGSAMRPGDVLTTYDGTTVEVLNTDAEGRLVLADALGRARLDLAPDVLVDIATLTGAASLGLGRRHGAVYSRWDVLAEALVGAGQDAGDQAWRMPLVDDYRAAMDSPVADLSNISRDRHVSGGSITAALFLEHFVGSVPWAHLDIAGPARADSDERETTKGATGYGTRLLLRWLERGAPA
jgi:leucyl aminopeptidase